MILRASGLEYPRVKSMTKHKSDSALPTLKQQVQSSAIISNIVAGSTQYQVSKERALMEIQQNQLVEEARFQVQAALTSSQIASTSYVSQYSIIPSRQSFLVGQFHNYCIFNIKNFSN